MQDLLIEDTRLRSRKPTRRQILIAVIVVTLPLSFFILCFRSIYFFIKKTSEFLKNNSKNIYQPLNNKAAPRMRYFPPLADFLGILLGVLMGTILIFSNPFGLVIGTLAPFVIALTFMATIIASRLPFMLLSLTYALRQLSGKEYLPLKIFMGFKYLLSLFVGFNVATMILAKKELTLLDNTKKREETEVVTSTTLSTSKIRSLPTQPQYNVHMQLLRAGEEVRNVLQEPVSSVATVTKPQALDTTTAQSKQQFYPSTSSLFNKKLPQKEKDAGSTEAEMADLATNHTHNPTHQK